MVRLRISGSRIPASRFSKVCGGDENNGQMNMPVNLATRKNAKTAR